MQINDALFILTQRVIESLLRHFIHHTSPKTVEVTSLKHHTYTKTNALVFRTTSDPLQNMELRKMSLKVFIFKSKLHYVRSTQGICILLMKCQEYPKF